MNRRLDSPPLLLAVGMLTVAGSGWSEIAGSRIQGNSYRDLLALFEGFRSSMSPWSPTACHLDQDVIANLIGERHGAMKHAAVIVTRVYVAQEVGDRHGPRSASRSTSKAPRSVSMRTRNCSA